MKLYSNKCCVCGFYRRTGVKSKSLFQFPQNEELFEKWISFSKCDKNEVKAADAKICEDHFEKSCVELKGARKWLQAGSVPSISASVVVSCIANEKRGREIEVESPQPKKAKHDEISCDSEPANDDYQTNSPTSFEVSCDPVLDDITDVSRIIVDIDFQIA